MTNTKEILLELLAAETGLAKTEIPENEQFENLNMDSLSIVSLAFELEKVTAIDNIEPTVFIEHNTVNKLAYWLNNRQ